MATGRITTPRPGTQPAGQQGFGEIEIEGLGRYSVSNDFFSLGPEQQQAAIAEIRADVQSGRLGAEPQVTTQPDQSFMDSYLRTNPVADAAGGYGVRTLVGALRGVGGVLDNAAELAQGGYNLLVPEAWESHSATRANEAGQGFEGLAAPLGTGNPEGRAAGEIGASALLTRGFGGPIRQGAATGALLSEADNPADFARDVAIGGAAGQGGDLVARGLASVVAPAVERGARLLHDARVRLSPGQVIPGLRAVEDRMLNWPWVGPGLQAQRREGFEDFARAIPRQAHDTMRTGLPGRNIAPMADDLTGQEAIRVTGDQASGIYQDIIPRLRLRADDELVTGIGEIGANIAGEPLSANGREAWERILRRGVMSRFRSGPEVTGAEYEAADTFLERQIARFGRSDDPDNQIIAGGLQDIRATLRNAIVRQNGALGRELEVVDDAWAQLVPAEAAAANAPRGFFSPAQYRRELRSGDNRVRRRGMARGEVRGQELAEAGQDVLPPQYPNYSGTGGQEAYNLMDMRFYQGLGARALYGRGTRDAITSAAMLMDKIPRGLTEPVASALRALPAPQAGAIAAPLILDALRGN